MEERKKMKEKILDLLADARLEQLDEEINSDEEYQSVRKEQMRLQEQFETLELTEEQRSIVHDLLTKANQCGAIYGKSVYKQGIMDGLKFMKELKKKK